MNTTEISALARQLYDARGAKAIAEAARRSEQLAQAGDSEQAKIWERVEAVLREMSGPRQT